MVEQRVFKARGRCVDDHFALSSFDPILDPPFCRF
jgi:hypothetical protein